jgi:tripartite-type tricarboxylate transporter receptor subunit TctC
VKVTFQAPRRRGEDGGLTPLLRRASGLRAFARFSIIESHQMVVDFKGLATMKTRRKLSWLAITVVLAALSLTLSIGAVAQQDYPSRPVKVVVPFVAGGIADVLARLVAEKMHAKLGVAFIVENRAGASGNIGAEAVARAEPDGYTLLVTPPPPLAINQSLFPDLRFDPSAFVPVTVIAAAPNILVVRPDAPATIRELIAFAKANPDKLSYASTGSGGTPHLTAEMFKRVTGVQIVHVPYKGMPPALTDLLGGRVDMMFANLSDALPHINSGKLHALGIAAPARFSGLPDVPTVSETLPGFVSETWFAMVAPPRTPTPIVARLSSAVAEGIRLPETARTMRELSVVPVGSSPAEAADFIRLEANRWRDIIVSAAIKPD